MIGSMRRLTEEWKSQGSHTCREAPQRLTTKVLAYKRMLTHIIFNLVQRSRLQAFSCDKLVPCCRKHIASQPRPLSVPSLRRTLTALPYLMPTFNRRFDLQKAASCSG